MTVFDQHETEASSIYSGSTTSRILWGNVLQNRAAASPEASASIDRYVIGNKISGLNLDYRQSLWLYSDMLYYFSGANAKGNVRHNIVFSDETYFDSFTANPLDIYLMGLSSSGITGSMIDADLLSGNFDLGIKSVPSASSIKIFVGNTEPAANTVSSLQKPVSPWFSQFPFESIYKNLVRLYRINYEGTSTIVKTNYASNGHFGHFTGSNIGTLAYVTSASYGTGTGMIFLVCDATASSTDQIPIGHTATTRIKETNKVRPTYAVFSKAFFGIGDGMFKTVSPMGSNANNTREPFLRYSPSFYDVSGTAGISFGPKLRGFKYGLYNCQPQRSKYVYRLGHFGHMRDMLEQPVYSKMKLDSGETSYFLPVEITFVSSSTIAPYISDYINATTASWYNPHDSGIFDHFYRSGQPFHDDINILSINAGES